MGTKINMSDIHNLVKNSIAVIIVGTNEAGWLQPAIQSILDNDFRGILKIIYIDNCSNDNSIQLIKEYFPSVEIIANNSNLGFAQANNLGIDYALKEKFNYIFLVNPDTFSPKTLLNDLLNFMNKHSDFAVIGPLQCEYNKQKDGFTDQNLNNWSKQALHNGTKHAFHMDFDNYIIEEQITFKFNKVDNVIEHYYVQGAAIFIRSQALEKEKGFDVNFHTFYEEVDLCRRFRWSGLRVGLLTNAFIKHKGGGSTESSIYKRTLMMRNKYYFLFTDPSWDIKMIRMLAWKWFKNDIKAFFANDKIILLKNIYWLISKMPVILKKESFIEEIISPYL